MANAHAEPSAAGRDLIPDVKTLGALAELAGMDCPIGEIAMHFRVSVDAMKSFIRDTPEARAALRRGNDEGIERLRLSIEKHKSPKRAKTTAATRKSQRVT